MNLLTSVQTEALITQNTLPSKAADPAAENSGGSFRDCLEGIGTPVLQESKSRPAPQKEPEGCKEKQDSENKNTDDNTVPSAPFTATVYHVAYPGPGDSSADTSAGNTGDTDSPQKAGQENAKAVVSVHPDALSGAPLQPAVKDNHQKSNDKTYVISDTDPKSIPADAEKEAVPITDKIIHDGINPKTGPSSSQENTAVLSTVSGENAPAQDGPRSPAIPVMPQTAQAVAAEGKASPNALLQQSEGDAEINLNGGSGSREKVTLTFPDMGLTNNRAAGEKEPDSSNQKMVQTDNATEQAARTGLQETPKPKASDVPLVQKGEDAGFNSQGKSANKTHEGQNKDTAAASAGTTELSDGNRSQPGKDFMQQVKPEQIVPRKEIITELEQNDIKKDQTGHTYQTNEKSGELFSLQDSNATAANGLRVVHQKTEIADISQISRENFVVTRKDNTSIELTIEPEGMGKLNIQLSLEKGAIHARINASEDIGKEFIDRNLNNIMQTLSDEGINIGSFSIHLRDRRNEFPDEEKDGRTYRGATTASPLPVSLAGNSTINIFV